MITKVEEGKHNSLTSNGTGLCKFSLGHEQHGIPHSSGSHVAISGKMRNDGFQKSK